MSSAIKIKSSVGVNCKYSRSQEQQDLSHNEEEAKGCSV